IELSRIKDKIYTQLYSVRSLSKSSVEYLKSICKLDDELRRWHDNIPADIQPEHSLHCALAVIAPVIMMQLAYFSCITTLHRAS
ncbi:hypothetical protein AOQ84DRAFT_271710, partial [Glonium stellatum]